MSYKVENVPIVSIVAPLKSIIAIIMGQNQGAQLDMQEQARFSASSQDVDSYAYLSNFYRSIDA